MQRVFKINKINEMPDDLKEKFIELVHINCKETVRTFLQSNKEYIKKQLSGSMARVFETEVLKQKKLKPLFLKQILEKLDDEKSEKFNTKILKSLFSKDKDLADAIANKHEYDEKQLVTFLCNEDTDRDTICDFLECFGIEIGLSEDEIKKEIEKAQSESLEKELNKIKNGLKNRYKDQTIEIKNVIDEELIAGYRVVVNNEAIDMSLKNSLEQLKKSL